MTRLDNDLISRKALLEAIKADRLTNASDAIYFIENAPTIEADSGEADAEVYSTAVYPNSNGMYEHTFLFNDRLAQQTELYLYNPNKYQKREWVELTDEQIRIVGANMYGFAISSDYIEFARNIESELKEVNHE
jgi:hypothetical protein